MVVASGTEQRWGPVHLRDWIVTLRPIESSLTTAAAGEASASDSHEASTLVVTLRQASADDADFLRDMVYTALFVPPGSPPFARSILDDPAIDRYVRDWGRRPGDEGVVACADAAPAGAAWLRYFAADSPGYGYVDAATPELTIAVIAACRNQGIGARLVTYLQERVPAISLSCDPLNPALRLYRRKGFEPLPTGRTLLWKRGPSQLLL